MFILLVTLLWASGGAHVTQLRGYDSLEQCQEVKHLLEVGHPIGLSVTENASYSCVLHQKDKP